MKLVNAIGLIALAIGLLPTVAGAQTVTKTVERGRDVIYVSGLTANQQVQLSSSSGTRATAILANGCGLVRVRSNQVTTGSVNINGTARSTANAVTVTEAPACEGVNAPWTGGLSSEPRRDGAGNLYFTGYTPNSAVTLLVPATGTRRATANGCGFARFTESESAPWPNDFPFTIGATDHNLSTVTSATHPPYCRNTGTSQSPNFVLYMPAS